MKPKVVSLFSGAMGLDLGLEKAGFQSVVCNEIDEAAVNTIRLNRPKIPVIDESIASVDGKDLCAAAAIDVSKVDLVAGGPPCQSFSVFGRRGGIQDPRGQLVFDFIRIVRELAPPVFIMENVRGLLSMPLYTAKIKKDLPKKDLHLSQAGSLLQTILEEYKEAGYSVDCYVVNSANYGAPQIRERVILIGNRYGLQSAFPDPTHSNRPEDGLPPFTTLGEVIGRGFKDPCPEVMNFSARKLKYLAMVPAGGNWRSLPIEAQKESMGKSWYLKGGRSAYWRKLSFNFPSPTVVTMPNHAGTSMCHPTELRAISVGEAAAIQEFPATWQFTGSVSEKFRQVGNAVPVRLGQIAGQEAMRLLKIIREMERRNPVRDARIIHIRPHVRTRSFWKEGEAFAGDVSYYDKRLRKKRGGQLDLEL
jgi:DNA (cytosine-5)-methyltransferase 1